MKNLITFICISLLCTNIAFAQEAGKLRAGTELGTLFPISGEVSYFEPALELKYNIRNNMNIGLTAEYSFLNVNKGFAEFESYYATYDYYFHYGSSRLAPFTGCGVGYCHGYSYAHGYYIIDNPACFVHSGFEFGKLRLSLTYNVIRKQNSFINMNYDHIALSAGFYIGGGKWGSKQPAAGKKLIVQR